MSIRERLSRRDNPYNQMFNALGEAMSNQEQGSSSEPHSEIFQVLNTTPALPGSNTSNQPTGPVSTIPEQQNSADRLASLEQEIKDSAKWQFDNKDENIKYGGQEMSNQLLLTKYNNEYNSPLAQMERYREAGLNPNMMYNAGKNATPSSIASVNGKSGMSKTQKTLQNLAFVKEAMGQMAEISSIQNSNRKAISETALTWQKLETEIQVTQRTKHEVENVIALTNKINSETDLNKLQAIYQDALNKQIPLDVAIKEANLSNLEQDTLLAYHQMLETVARTQGINVETAMNTYNLNNLLPLQKEMQEYLNESQQIQTYLDRDYAWMNYNKQSNQLLGLANSMTINLQEQLKNMRARRAQKRANKQKQ